MKKLIVLVVMIFCTNAFADYYYDDSYFSHEKGRIVIDLGVAKLAKNDFDKIRAYKNFPNRFDPDTGYHVNLGYQMILSKYLSIEPFLSYYSFKDDFSVFLGEGMVGPLFMKHNVEIKSVPIGVNVYGTLPIGKMFELYAFAGFSVNFNEFWYRLEHVTSVSHNDASVGAQCGAGFNILLGKRFLVGFKYTYAYSEQKAKYLKYVESSMMNNEASVNLDTSKHVFAARFGIRI